MFITGAVKSTSPFSVSVPSLPAASTAEANTVYKPSASASVVILQLPCSSTWVTNVCTCPALSVTVIVTSSPALMPDTEPLITTVCDAESGNSLMVTTGATVSIFAPILSLTGSPFGSIATTSITIGPSGSGSRGGVVKVPSG